MRFSTGSVLSPAVGVVRLLPRLDVTGRRLTGHPGLTGHLGLAVGADRCDGLLLLAGGEYDDEHDAASDDGGGDDTDDDPYPEQSRRVLALGVDRGEGTDIGPGGRVAVHRGMAVRVRDLGGERDRHGGVRLLQVGEIGCLEDVSAVLVLDGQIIVVTRALDVPIGRGQDALVALGADVDVSTRVVEIQQLLGAVEAGGRAFDLHGEGDVERVVLVDGDIEGARDVSCSGDGR